MIPLVMGGEPKVGEDGTPEVKADGSTLATVLTALRYICMLGMYGGFTGVCVGASIMEAPKSVYPDGAPPVSPAVACTMNLCFQYFAVYLGIALIQTYQSFYGESTTSSKWKATFTLLSNTVSFAPMLAVLFIGARMRALNMDPVNGNPQKWAQTCFSVAVPLVLQGEVKVGKCEGDMEYTVENKMFGTILAIGRYVMMICLYIGAGCVIYSIFTIEHPKGPE